MKKQFRHLTITSVLTLLGSTTNAQTTTTLTAPVVFRGANTYNTNSYDFGKIVNQGNRTDFILGTPSQAGERTSEKLTLENANMMMHSTTYPTTNGGLAQDWLGIKFLLSSYDAGGGQNSWSEQANEARLAYSNNSGSIRIGFSKPLGYINAYLTNVWLAYSEANTGNFIVPSGAMSVSGNATLNSIEIGKKRNSDMSILMHSGNSGWKRIGSDGPLTFWANGKASTDDAPQLFLGTNGNLGIGTGNATQRLTVYNGTTTGTYTTTGWAHSSDARLKENIREIEAPLDVVKKLRGVFYTFKNDPESHRQLGFLAQEVQKVVPEVVVGKEGDIEKGETLAMVYQNIVPLLVEAIKVESNQIDELTKKIDILEKKIELISISNQHTENVAKPDNTIQADVSLDQNIPNPFSKTTSINYTINGNGNVLIELYDQKGNKIKTLENSTRNEGTYTLQLDGSPLESGTYIYTIKFNNKNISRKAIKL